MVLDRPDAGAGQEVEKALLALDHAIGEAEGADEGFAFDPDLVEQDTPRRIPIAVDVRVDDVGVAGEFLITQLERNHRCQIEILQDILEAGVDVDRRQRDRVAAVPFIPAAQT